MVRPVAYLLGEQIVCAGCADAESIFACRECGSEQHLYGSRRCARCVLRERLSTLLTDPATGRVHARLQPLFEEIVGSDRPQTGIWWLRRKPGVGPALLGQMARGEVQISHDTFRALPSDRAHDYLRTLLAAVGVIEPFDPRVERMAPWIKQFLTTVPEQHAGLLRRYTRWQVLPAMRLASEQGRLTQTAANAQRRRIRVAAEFLAYLDTRGVAVQDATQGELEDYQLQVRRSALRYEYSFIAWLRSSRINTALHVPYTPTPQPEVTISDEHRWDIVERLLHEDTLRRYTRIGGLFTLLFAQPLSRIVAMRTAQVTDHDGCLYVSFADVPIQIPPLLEELIREHLADRGKSLYASRGTRWLFPGGNPGRHLATENIRSQLVAIGMNPYQGRKAALYQLASSIPAPILAELIGISQNNAAQWAHLAARDWSSYVASRA